MDQATHNKIVSFIWGIADDVLRDLFKRGIYRTGLVADMVACKLDARPAVRDLPAIADRKPSPLGQSAERLMR